MGTGIDVASYITSLLERKLFLPFETSISVMYNPRTWGAWILLAAFVVGGVVTPVLHRVDHASRWNQHYGEFLPSESDEHRNVTVQEEFSWSYRDCSCPLCHQHFFSVLPADLRLVGLQQIEPLRAAVYISVRLSPPAFHQTRAPPVALV